MTEFPFHVVTECPDGTSIIILFDEALHEVLGKYYDAAEYQVEFEECDAGVTAVVHFANLVDAAAFRKHMLERGFDARDVQQAKQNPADH
jgi:hypothetical protein